MAIYQKVVDAEGKESYVEVDPKTLELPEDHPVNAKLAAVTKESIERRERLRELKSRLAELENEGGTPEAQKPAQKPEPAAAAPDLDTLTEQLLQRIDERSKTAQQQQQAREAAVNAILQETGLSDDYRSVLAAIPDPNVAREQAKVLAAKALKFGEAPAGGNGRPDADVLVKNVSKRLGLVP